MLRSTLAALGRFRGLAIAAAAVALVGFGLFAHYYLPRGEVVVLTGTEVMRFRDGVDEAAGDQERSSGTTRDVRLIYARTPEAKSVRTYRNEDALWYGKFDSGTLNSVVQSILLDQQKGTEVRVLALSYGWRLEWLSEYPNLISIVVVGSDYVYWHWHAALVIAILIGLLAAIMWWTRKAVRAARKAAEGAVASARGRLNAVVAEAGETAARAARSVQGAPRPPEPPPKPRAAAPNVSSER